MYKHFAYTYMQYQFPGQRERWALSALIIIIIIIIIRIFIQEFTLQHVVQLSTCILNLHISHYLCQPHSGSDYMRDFSPGRSLSPPVNGISTWVNRLKSQPGLNFPFNQALGPLSTQSNVLHEYASNLTIINCPEAQVAQQIILSNLI